MSSVSISPPGTPAWFPAALGTALMPQVAQVLPGASVTVPLTTGLAILAGLLVLVPWVRNLIRTPEMVKTDWKHPVWGLFFPMIPALVVALGWDLVFYERYTALVLILLGTLGTLVLGLRPEFDTRRGGPVGGAALMVWFVPCLSYLLAFLGIGDLMLTEAFPGWKDPLNLLGFIGLGAGTFLFLLTASFVFQRSLTGEGLPPAWASLDFLFSVPASLLCLATLTIQGPIPWSLWVPFLFWGFAIWSFLQAVIRSVVQHKTHKVPFGLLGWVPLFSLAALTVATGALGTAEDSLWLTVLAVGMGVTLTGWWGWAAVQTVLTWWRARS